MHIMARNWPGAHAEWTRPARPGPSDIHSSNVVPDCRGCQISKADGRALTAARQLLPPDAVPSWSGMSKLENGGEVISRP